VTTRRRDAYYRRARDEGYRARSAYKLAELDRRYHVLRPGAAVVDLGAAPGAWLQVAGERVGPRGRVVGLDLAAIEPLGAPNVAVVCGDVRDRDTVAAVRAALGRDADVVLCDLAPKLTGVRATDRARCDELFEATLAALAALLRPGGSLLVKMFMSTDFGRHRDRLQGSFASVRTTRVEATRRGSAELYAVAAGYRGPSPASPGGC
jgi:23S rRNA (uridine2552-2'-O)-methyltransferase